LSYCEITTSIKRRRSSLPPLIKTYSNEGDVVLDFCAGSGTTAVACVNTNRNFIGIEMDENYFNIAESRINKALNEKEN
jgi:site-specific DNA-methyltransferase (adenine-specific)